MDDFTPRYVVKDNRVLARELKPGTFRSTYLQDTTESQIRARYNNAEIVIPSSSFELKTLEIKWYSALAIVAAENGDFQQSCVFAQKLVEVTNNEP